MLFEAFTDVNDQNVQLVSWDFAKNQQLVFAAGLPEDFVNGCYAGVEDCLLFVNSSEGELYYRGWADSRWSLLKRFSSSEKILSVRSLSKGGFMLKTSAGYKTLTIATDCE